MEYREADRSDSAHDAIENNELGLILHDRVGPTTRHLSDTEHASDEDDEERNHEGGSKELEVARREEIDRCLGEGAAALEGVEAVVCHEGCEGDESDNLPDDTGHHEVVADGLHVFVFG